MQETKEIYFRSVVTNLVDNVCLYEARKDALITQAQSTRNSQNNTTDSVEQDEEISEEFKAKIDKLKLNPVLQSRDDYVPDVSANLKNEQD